MQTAGDKTQRKSSKAEKIRGWNRGRDDIDQRDATQSCEARTAKRWRGWPRRWRSRWRRKRGRDVSYFSTGLKFLTSIIAVNVYLIFSYCFRIRLENLCASCKNGGKLIACDTCSNRYHLECVEPPLSRAPRGRWSCTKCKDKRRNATKGNGEITEEYTSENVLRALFFCYNAKRKSFCV